MLVSILFGIFLVIMAVGTYYQIQTHKGTHELHALQMKNEFKRSELLDLKAKKIKAEQHYFELVIQDGKKGT